MIRWIGLATCAAGVAAAFLVPGVSAWLGGQWQVLAAKSPLDQVAFACSVIALLGVSALASSWKYLGVTRQLRQKLHEDEAALESARGLLDQEMLRLAALKAVDADELMQTALAAPHRDPGRSRDLAALAKGLPCAARNLGLVLAPYAASEAEALSEFAAAFEARERP